jgi:hypothetical protein
MALAAPQMARMTASFSVTFAAIFSIANAAHPKRRLRPQIKRAHVLSAFTHLQSNTRVAEAEFRRRNSGIARDRAAP